MTSLDDDVMRNLPDRPTGAARSGRTQGETTVSDPDPRKRQPASVETVVDHEKARETERRVDSDSGLSPAIEQQGGAALANIGKRRASDSLFRD